MKERVVTRQEVIEAFAAWATVWEQKEEQENQMRLGRGMPTRTASEAAQIREFAGEVAAAEWPESGEVSTFCQLAPQLPSWRKMRITVEKSNFLGRVLVAGEPVRTRACPAHKGHWSGIPMPLEWVKDRYYFSDPYVCGCQGTGWLPEGAPMPETITFDEVGRCSHCGATSPVNSLGFMPCICLSCERQAIPWSWLDPQSNG